MLTASAAAWVAWTAGGAAWEYHHRASAARVPHRILVSGMRGKTTAVRLVRAALEAASLRVLSRESGDAPVTIHTDGTRTMTRRIGPANIRELRRTVRIAARERAGALCLENMAVQPHLAAAVARGIVRPTACVFTFDAPDHLEVFPADAEQRARVFAQTFPPDCPVFLPDTARNSAVISALSASGREVVAVSPAGASLRSHADALAGVALELLEHIGAASPSAGDTVIETAEALQRLTVYRLTHSSVVDLLSANDPDSVQELIALLKAEDRVDDPPAMLFLHRSDRPGRFSAFAPLLARHNSAIAGDPVPGREMKRAGLMHARDPMHYLSACEGPVLLLGNATGSGAHLRRELITSGSVETW